MIELNEAALGRLPAGVAGPAYDRGRVSPGIVHLSVGNFHRAHQGWFLDRLIAGGGHDGWGLAGVALLDVASERAKAASFAAQDGLYTLTRFEPDGRSTCQVIGSMVEFLFAPDDGERVLGRMADAATRIVTMTITEGGYNQERETGRYRTEVPEVAAELAAPERPRSAFGFIVEALRRRRAAGVAAFTVQSCDNLSGNGDAARRAVLAHAEARDASLARWIEAEVAFPNSMVDGITPATGPAEWERLNRASGLSDAVPVFSETTMIWVIEDRFVSGRPDYGRVGAQMVDDVRPYELAKLHLLNASHSMLAYPARLAGIETIDDAMGTAPLVAYLDAFMRDDVTPMLERPPGMDLDEFRTTLLARFSNRAIRDQVARVAGNGAAKLPVFLGPVVRAVDARGGDVRRLAFGIACFLQYLAGRGDGALRFAPDEPLLAEGDRALAADADPAAALGMELLGEIGVTREGRLAGEILRLRRALDERDALSVLRGLIGTD